MLGGGGRNTPEGGDQGNDKDIEGFKSCIHAAEKKEARRKLRRTVARECCGMPNKVHKGNS